MSGTDGGLRSIYNAHLRGMHLLPIETGMTVQGVPDTNGCDEGVEFWIENKRVYGKTIRMRPKQVGWHTRRAIAGGRSFIAARRETREGPRLGEEVDELYLFFGVQAREVLERGIDAKAILVETGGPSRWNWKAIREVLLFAPLPKWREVIAPVAGGSIRRLPGAPAGSPGPAPTRPRSPAGSR